jgi:hypothetical protein
MIVFGLFAHSDLQAAGTRNEDLKRQKTSCYHN